MSGKNLRTSLLTLLYEHKEEHIGSCFSCLDIIDDIFKKKRKEDIFILSNGHASYALYCILEKYGLANANDLATRHRGHPNIDHNNGIYCSTGSLGQGITIACGAAIASPEKKIYVTISDGECAEGSVWEALRLIHDRKLNVEVHVNANGYACYDPIDVTYLERRCKAFLPNINFHKTTSSQLSFLRGLEAHYIKMDEAQYKKGLEEIRNEC